MNRYDYIAKTDARYLIRQETIKSNMISMDVFTEKQLKELMACKTVDAFEKWFCRLPDGKTRDFATKLINEQLKNAWVEKKGGKKEAKINKTIPDNVFGFKTKRKTPDTNKAKQQTPKWPKIKNLDPDWETKALKQLEPYIPSK